MLINPAVPTLHYRVFGGSDRRRSTTKMRASIVSLQLLRLGLTLGCVGVIRYSTFYKT